MAEQRRIYRTGQVAKLFGVACRTVAKACDAGWLKSWRVQTGQDHDGDRRIDHRDLIEFMQQRNMPLSLIGEIQRHGIVLGGDKAWLDRLQAANTAEWRWEQAGTVFQAGILSGKRIPSALVVDCVLGSWECRQAIYGVQEANPKAVVVIVDSDDGVGKDMAHLGLVVQRGEWKWIEQVVSTNQVLQIAR